MVRFYFSEHQNPSELNVFLSFFLVFYSTSACYWDPEVSLLKQKLLVLQCAVNGQDFNALAGLVLQYATNGQDFNALEGFGDL